MQKVRSHIVLKELITTTASPTTMKRSRKETLPVGERNQVSPVAKKVKLSFDEKPMITRMEKAMVASALLELKGSNRSPIVQWTKLFDVPCTSGDECSTDDEEAENNAVSVLVQAAFSKKHRRTFPSVARLAGVEHYVKPDDFLKQLLKNEGKRVTYVPASSLTGFFTEVTDDFVNGYTMDVVRAVRENDVDALRRLKAEGHTLLCGSKFGDSVVHLACRRNCAEVLSFLLNEVGISPRLTCDFGRTPLHDALWVSQPNESIVKMLLKACPDLLYITDKRGATPMAYLPKACWADMCKFLEYMDSDSLVPQAIHQQ